MICLKANIKKKVFLFDDGLLYCLSVSIYKVLTKTLDVYLKSDPYMFLSLHEIKLINSTALVRSSLSRIKRPFKP